MNTRDLNKLARATISSKGELGKRIDYKPEMRRRQKALSNFTKQGGVLAGDACELAPLIIEHAAQMDNKASWGPVTVAVGLAKTALNNAARNPDISDEAVIKGYKDTLDVMAKNKNQLCLSNGLFEVLENEFVQLIQDPKAARSAIEPVAPITWKSSTPVPIA